MGILYNPNLYKFFVDPFLSKTRTKITSFIALKETDKVLDICCGTGDQAEDYAKSKAKVIGIDINENMIKIAKKREDKYHNLEFKRADASALPFEDSVFDYTTICLGLHEINEGLRRKIFSEMERVTKKEGYIILTDYSVPLPKKFSSTLIKGIEYLSEHENYPNFKDYLKKGGLDSLINNHHIINSDKAQGGVLSLIKLANERGISNGV